MAALERVMDEAATLPEDEFQRIVRWFYDRYFDPCEVVGSGAEMNRLPSL